MFQPQFYPQSQHRTSFHNNRGQNHLYMPPHSTFYRTGPVPNNSNHQMNYSRIFEPNPTPSHGFSSMANGNYLFNDITNQQTWKPNMPRNQQAFNRVPAYYFQDKSTYYYMSEPMVTNNNRISIQLTKVHVGRNGVQQRVFVEQEFSNQRELKKFVKNLKQNFEKTFNNNCTTGTSNNNNNNNENVNDYEPMDNNKSGVVVIEEPDEEPKVYEQNVYNENIRTRHKPKDVKYPLVPLTQTSDNDKHQRTKLESSTSTIYMGKHRKSKMKHYHANQNNDQNKKQHYQKTSNYYQNYDIPPRFQQQFYNKENLFRMTNEFDIPRDFNMNWRYNQHQDRLYNQSYSFILPTDENLLPQDSAIFHYRRNSYYHAQTPPPNQFTHLQDQQRGPQQRQSSRYRRIKKQRRNQPATIVDSFIFQNNKQQTRVHRSRSQCQSKITLANHSKINRFLGYGLNTNQRHFIQFISPRATIFCPQRRLIRNTELHYRPLNPYRPNTIRF